MVELIKHISKIITGIFVDETVFKTGSQPISFSKMSFGGDALNEAIVLSYR